MTKKPLHRAQVVVLVAAGALANFSVSSSAWAAGTVGTGTALSCTDDALHTALIGGGLVTFNCGSAPVTIDLTSLPGAHGTETIAADTTIDGGRLITISGGNNVQVFAVNGGVTLILQKVTIADGKSPSGAGGGVLNNGVLTVTNGTFSNNDAGPGGFGGGIFNNGSISISESTFSDNNASLDGGGIFSNGPITIDKSTFVGNTGGFIGGAIYNDFTTLTITNSTFVNNTAAVFNSGGLFTQGQPQPLPVINSTFVQSSIFDNTCCGVPFTLTNTILSDTFCSGFEPIGDGGHNLQFPGVTCSGTFTTADPMLDPSGLANNGGPTQTVALQVGSAAIDAGDQGVCVAPPVSSRDQRGYRRPGHGSATCSVGAFEFRGLSPQPVGAPAPAASATGLIGLIALLSALGWQALRRPAR